jgi:hypothetical protein
MIKNKIISIAFGSANVFWWGNLKQTAHWENPGVDRRIILRWILRKWDVRAWTGLMWFWIGHVAGT